MVDPDALSNFIESSNILHKENANSFIMDCPNCGHSEKAYVRKVDGFTVCWSCTDKSPSPNPEYLLAKILGVSVHAVKASLYGDEIWTNKSTSNHIDVQFKDFNETETPYVLPDLPVLPIPSELVSLGHPAFLKAQNYLAGRNISENIIKNYNILFNPRTERIIFPLVIDGKYRGHQDRYMGLKETYKDKEGIEHNVPKALTSLDRSKCLLFQDRLKTSKHAILCEGPIDAIRCDLIGQGNVASMGKKVSLSQLQIILYHKPEAVYLALDPDAYQETMKIVQWFYDNDFKNLFLLKPALGRKDLGECTYEEVKQQYAIAEPISPNTVLMYLK